MGSGAVSFLILMIGLAVQVQSNKVVFTLKEEELITDLQLEERTMAHYEMQITS